MRRTDSGNTADARPSAISCNSCVWSRTCGPGPSGEEPSRLCQLATLPDDGPTGGFFEDAGVVPW